MALIDHRAEARRLNHAAEEQSTAGDHRLLSYCTGLNGGMKKGLQKIRWALEVARGLGNKPLMCEPS